MLAIFIATKECLLELVHAIIQAYHKNGITIHLDLRKARSQTKQESYRWRLGQIHSGIWRKLKDSCLHIFFLLVSLGLSWGNKIRFLSVFSSFPCSYLKMYYIIQTNAILSKLYFELIRPYFILSWICKIKCNSYLIVWNIFIVLYFIISLISGYVKNKYYQAKG